MKKYIVILFFNLILAHSAFAETTIPWTKEGCESVKGTWITAHSPTDDGCDAAHCNGKNFCRSAQPMNWFNALIWCKSIGRTAASYEHVCPGVPIGSNESPCSNLHYSGTCPNGWTSMPRGNDQAFIVSLNWGNIQAKSRTATSDYFACNTHALCE